MFLDMFKHKGKFTSVAGRRNIKSYQNLYLVNKKDE